MLMLDEDESFSLSANVLSPGYQSIALRGYLVSTRNGEVWVAPLIPQLFYGANGQPLSTWRQYLPSAGSQVILSRSGGKPKVPREELFWRKVAEVAEVAVTEIPQPTPTPKFPWTVAVASVVAAAVVGYVLWKK